MTDNLKPGLSPVHVQAGQLLVQLCDPGVSTEKKMILFGQATFGPDDPRSAKEGQYLLELNRLRVSALRQGRREVADAFTDLIMRRLTKVLDVPYFAASTDIKVLPWS